MYTLIIVDDEDLAIAAIKSCINWNEMGISRIFTANSAFQAEAIFKNNDIDIMVCDIEMPQEDGLELLFWVKKNYPLCEAIIQSCHSDFKYVKKAMQLESLDYILKPVLADDMKNAINRAIKNIKTHWKSTAGSQSEESDEIPAVLTDILKSLEDSENESLEKTVENQVALQDHNPVFPILALVKNMNGKANFHFPEVIRDLMSRCVKMDISKNYHCVELDKNIYVILISWAHFRKASDISEELEYMLETIFDDYALEVMCGIGNTVSFDNLIPTLKDLLHLCRSNYFNTLNRAFVLNKENLPGKNHSMPDIAYWSTLLEVGANNNLLKEITAFFYNISDDLKTDSYYLKEIRDDFLQMLFTVLEQKGLQSNQMFYDNMSNELFSVAHRSVQDMLKWIEHVVARASNIIQTLIKENSIIEKCIRYIKLHIDQDIKREDVAACVYLNPDYLSRIFKKETNLSLSTYIIKERIDIAKKLLENTDLQISSIAIRVGYKNFSYFAKIFRKNVGMNPIEFKNSFK